jgi:hypothetical protein
MNQAATFTEKMGYCWFIPKSAMINSREPELRIGTDALRREEAH